MLVQSYYLTYYWTVSKTNMSTFFSELQNITGTSFALYNSKPSFTQEDDPLLYK